MPPLYERAALMLKNFMHYNNGMALPNHVMTAVLQHTFTCNTTTKTALFPHTLTGKNMTTIAQQLKIKDFPFAIKDKNGNVIYWEKSNGYWEKNEYDLHDNLIGFEDSTGYWGKSEFNVDDKEIYYENYKGYSRKYEYDANGNVIYCEKSGVVILDKRLKVMEMTLEDIASKLGINVTQLRIKD